MDEEYTLISDAEARMMFMGASAVMHQWEFRFDEHLSLVVYFCPGCENWQVDAIHDTSTLATMFPVTEAADAHRAECPGLDRLARQAGVPLHARFDLSGDP